MASQTPHLNLTLPTGSENWQRSVINNNFTKIDAYVGTSDLGTLSDINALQSSLNSCDSSMNDGDFLNFRCRLAQGNTLFSATKYIGTLRKLTSTYLRVTIHEDGSNKVFEGKCYNGSWAWDQLALNSQMAKQVKYYTYEYTIAANSSLSITANNMGMDSPPSGYTPVAIAYYNTANANVIARGISATETNGSSNCIWLQNMSNSQQTGTMNVGILYLKF